MNVETSGQEFVVSRLVDARRERVWRAFTEPEHLKEWWPPQTFTMIAMNMDFRAGGAFHCGMRSHEGYKMWAKFVYREIAPPERIVFVNAFANEAGELKRHPIIPTWPMETVTAIALEDEPGDKTKITVHWWPHNATDIERKTFDMSHVGMKAIWASTFDRLVAHLAKVA